MEKFRKKNENTDAEETMFFRAASNGKSTDQYHTQKLSAEQIRRNAAQQNAASRNHPAYRSNQPYQNRYPGGAAQQQRQSNPRPGGYPQENRTNPAGQPYGSQPRPQQPGARPRPVQQSHPPYPQQHRNPPPRQGSYPAPQRRNQGQRHAPPRSYPEQRQGPPPRGHQPPKQRKQRSLLGKIVKAILSIIIALFLLYSAIAAIGIFSMNRVETGDRSVTSGSLHESFVKNILIIGTDSRDPEEERGRSDSMILVSLNSHTREIYMTSFMRDAYVDIPGKGSGKLNAAFSYGGPELLMDTLEENYDISIDDYVMITFAACAGMIDAVGGIELEISDKEAEAINEILISEVNEIMGDDREDDLLDGGGTLKLNGKQALSYSRIRYVGNADFERTERQRTVMSQVLKKVKGNPLRIAPICMTALPKMTTNMSFLSLYGYAESTPFKLLTYTIKQLRIPADGTFSPANIGGEDVLQVDFDVAKEQLSDTLFAN